MPAVFTELPHGERVTYLLPNYAYADRLVEYLVENGIVPEVKQNKSGTTRVNAEYPLKSIAPARFAIHLFEQQLARYTAIANNHYIGDPGHDPVLTKKPRKAPVARHQAAGR